MNDSWKSFWVGTTAAIVIALVAGMALQTTNLSAEQKFSTSSTRL